MDNFDVVWERVTGAVPDTEIYAEADDRAVLRGFMDNEAAACRFYAALASQCPTASRTLLHIAAQEREHLRLLQLEYFILSGDSYVPIPTCPVISGVLSSLRAAYIDELAANKAYLKAADETNNETLAANYREIASDEADHAAALRTLIERAL